jgi:acetate kinase
MQDGRSIDTTMGFTALDGLMMGTRCGAIDPGVLLYLMQQKGMSAEAVEDLLYRRSGLLGVSGLSSDMCTLLASDGEHAKEAIALYVFRAAREVAALTGSLGGLDAIVFTGGIGEHAAEIRHAICERLRWLGVDPHEPDGRVAIRVMTTDEEAVIAQQTLDLISGSEINLVPAHYFPSAERQPGRDHL